MIKRLLATLVIAGTVTAIGSSSTLAAGTTDSLQLRAPASVHNPMLKHVMGSVKVKHLPHDLDIKLTADGLPKPGALHEKAYVVFLTSGGKVMHLGTLHYMNNGMGTYTGMPMVTKYSQIAVWAVPSTSEMMPMGVKVLVTQRMHH
ncbi:MAG: hypothetical protein PVSMB7_23120 [Chloroflexota bacterium]